MIKILLVIVVAIQCAQVHAQNTDSDFLKTYYRVNAQRFFDLDKSDIHKYQKDTLEILEIQQLLDFFHRYLKEEHRLNGKAGFSFVGNETSTTNLFKIGVNGSIDKGSYPYEVDFSLDVQTTIQNKEFKENLSDIDVSFDFHPYVPSVGTKNDGLWLENYVVLKRFSNNFLGIEQRYEAGAGVIFNLFSRNKLTDRGRTNLSNFNNFPQYAYYEGDLKRCLEDRCTLKESVLGITEAEIETLVNTRERYKRSNLKKYSQLRLGILLGVYYELENTIVENSLVLDGEERIVTKKFDASNRFMWEVRPTLVWRPNDRCKLKIYPYLKMPFGDPYSNISEGGNVDRRLDYFVDLITALDIKVDKNFSVAIKYRLVYDHAPRRIFIQDSAGEYLLLMGQKQHAHYGISFNFGF